MIPRIERYETPDDLEAALALLAAAGDTARVVAGGTDLVLDWQTGRAAFAVAVDINRLPLRHLRLEGDELVVGALVTHRDLEQQPLVTERAPALALAAASIGGVQIRNMGTIGGNVANGIPSADLVPALLAMDGRVVLHSRAGSRTLPLEQFFTGLRRTVLAPDELITEFRVRNLAPAWQAGFAKFGRRRAQALATLNMAVALRLEAGRIADARVAAGLVAPVPVRLPATEAALRGAPAGPEALERAGEAIGTEVHPRDSLRGSAYYRRHLAVAGIRRLLRSLLGLE